MTTTKTIRLLIRIIAVPILQKLRTPKTAKLIHSLSNIVPITQKAPYKAYNRVKEWTTQNTNYGNTVTLFKTKTKPNPPPKTIHIKTDWRFDTEKSIFEKEIELSTLKNATVVGKAGAVITNNNILLGDLSPEWFFTPQTHSILFKPYLPKQTKLLGNTMTLATPSGWNYYHWLTDVIPRCAIAKKAGVNFDKIDNFLINECNNNFQIETLKAIGIPIHKCIKLTRNSNFTCETLIVSSMPSNNGTLSKWAIDYIDEIAPKSNGIAEKIYITRRKATYRKITNENEVLKTLSKLDFKVIELESITWPEQVNLFRNASYVIAPHGAGLTNLIFCKPQTKIIEIFAPQYVNTCFYNIATNKELDYYCIVGKGKSPSKHTYIQQVESDITIKINELEETLSRIGTGFSTDPHIKP